MPRLLRFPIPTPAGLYFPPPGRRGARTARRAQDASVQNPLSRNGTRTRREAGGGPASDPSLPPQYKHGVNKLQEKQPRASTPPTPARLPGAAAAAARRYRRRGRRLPTHARARTRAGAARRGANAATARAPGPAREPAPCALPRADGRRGPAPPRFPKHFPASGRNKPEGLFLCNFPKMAEIGADLYEILTQSVGKGEAARKKTQTLGRRARRGSVSVCVRV